jgi:hypothetical protein
MRYSLILCLVGILSALDADGARFIPEQSGQGSPCRLIRVGAAPPKSRLTNYQSATRPQAWTLKPRWLNRKDTGWCVPTARLGGSLALRRWVCHGFYTCSARRSILSRFHSPRPRAPAISMCSGWR